MPHSIRLVLAAPDETLVQAWDEEFAAWPSEVTTTAARLETLSGVDAYVTAGNSYGQMDGGVDRSVAVAFPGVQRAVWGAIAEESGGYLPVGSAVVVPTGSGAVPWLVYAPTMRVPMSIAAWDVAVHDAFWAALVAVDRHNRSGRSPIASIASPGMGTGYGRVAPARAARLMATAYRHWRTGSTASVADRERDLGDTGA